MKLISYHRRNGIQCKCGTLTPMHLACQNGHKQVVEAIATLVPEWVDSSDEDNDMQTPLHVASEKGYVEIVEILLTRRAGLKSRRNGVTAVHVAIEKGNIEVVRVLLSAHPDGVNSKDMNKETPLHIAARHCGDHPEIVSELINR